MAKSYRKQLNNHVITWSNKEGRYIVKNPRGKRVYDFDYVKDAISWIKRNS